MTKFAKMSMVAAVAVAGFASTASAQPLEEAIKGVDVSGYVHYRYENASDVNHADQQYKIGATAKVKAADDFTVTVGVSARDSEDTGGTNPGVLTDADRSASFAVSHANLTYTGVPGLTVIAGKQALNTPWTEGSSTLDATDIGNGVLALYNAGFATFAAGHMFDSNIKVDSDNIDTVGGVKTENSDLTVGAIIVPLSAINATAQAWFINVKDTMGNPNLDTNAASYNLAGKFGPVAYDARYSSLKADGFEKNTLKKVAVSSNVAGIDVAAAYAVTNKTSTDADSAVKGLVAFDSDGAAGFKAEILNLNGRNDADAILVSASKDVLANVNVGVTYVDVNLENNVGANETDVAVSYKASNKLTLNTVYATDKVDGAHREHLSRAEFIYKF